MLTYVDCGENRLLIFSPLFHLSVLIGTTIFGQASLFTSRIPGTRKQMLMLYGDKPSYAIFVSSATKKLKSKICDWTLHEEALMGLDKMRDDRGMQEGLSGASQRGTSLPVNRDYGTTAN
jgi:hypothetical protein